MLSSVRSLIQRLATALAASLALASCGLGDDGPIVVSVIGTPDELARPFVHIRSTAGRLALAETAQGLVAYDAEGEVIPGLAQRWIVEDDGRSYIFRLRRANWPNGERVDAREVAALLQARVRAVAASNPFGNMAAVTDVLPMTADVIEVRLAAPRPNFLPMLAQPQMGISRNAGGTGPYRRSQSRGVSTLKPVPSIESMGEDESASSGSGRHNRLVRAERASRAIARFAQGEADLVLGGTLGDLPYAQAATLRRDALELDPANGLFGLALTREGPLLRDAQVRSAIAMAIDRQALADLIGARGWSATDALHIATGDPRAPLVVQQDWSGRPIAERRANARSILINWRTAHGGEAAALSITLPAGPGYRLLYHFLRQQMAAIGITLTAVKDGSDLAIIDEVAAYDSAFWFLGRIGCARQLICDAEGDALLTQATHIADPDQRADLLRRAADVIGRAQGFIPLGAPLRWSLVDPRLTGFRPSPRALHPLSALVRAEP